MTISDASPIQFWVNGQESFNQKVVDGINHTCFCHKWECDDEIKIQGTYISGQNFDLAIYDSSDNFIQSIGFNEISSGVYMVTFIPSDYGLCDGDFIFKVRDSEVVATIMNVTNSNQITGFSNSGSGDIDWFVPPYTLSSTYFRSSTISPTIPNGTNIDIRVDVSDSLTSVHHLYVILSQSGGGSRQTIDFGNIAGSPITVNVTTNANYDQVELQATKLSSAGDLGVTTITITNTSTSSPVTINNPTFSSSLTPWSNYTVVNTPWAWNDGITDGSGFTSAIVDLDASGGDFSQVLIQTLSGGIISSGTIVNVSITYRATSAINPGGQMNVIFYDSSSFDGSEYTTSQIITSAGITGDGTDHTILFTDTLSINADIIGFEAGTSAFAGKIKVKNVVMTTNTITTYNPPNNDFTTSGSWTNTGTGIPWSIDTGTGQAVLTNPFSSSLKTKFYNGETTKQLIKTISMPVGALVDYEFNFLADTSELGSISIDVTVYLKKSGITKYTFSKNVDSESTEVLSGSLILSDNIDQIVFIAQNNGTAHEITLEVTKASITSTTRTDTIYNFTDCIDIRGDQAETKLINYSNHRNYDGLVYEGESPSFDFSIRIPAIFFRERFIEEDTSIELSNSRIIIANNSMKSQKLLATDYMPFYMHKKLLLVLKHQFVTIDNIDYIKEEKYEIQDVNFKQYSLSMAKVWLTEKNFLERNVL